MTVTNIHELDVLKWEAMTDTVRKFPFTGDHWFRKNLFTNKKQLRGTDTVVWDELTKTRRRAPFATRGQPAQRLDLLSRGMRSAQVADIFVSKVLRADQLEYLRRYGEANGNSADSGAQAIINDELEDMTERVMNTVEYACMSVARGSLAIDQMASTTAVKSRGVKWTLTFPVSTLSKLTSWATNTTKIYSTEIQAIFDKMAAVTGQMPTRAVHNGALMTNILQNDEVKEFMGDQYRTQLLQTGYVSSMRGINFQPYDTGDDESGSFAKYWSDSEALFLPPDNRYFELFEADALIPGPGDTFVSSGPGMYSYAQINKNPVSVELFVGYRFLPVNRYPERALLFTAT